MNCNNSKCKKEIRNYNICEECKRIYCSISCLGEHKKEDHSFQTNSQLNQKARQSGSKSLFMKFGTYEKEIFDDPVYDFSNFEFVKSDKKKSIGSGAFGDVYLATNKLDNKLYAIKVMEKVKIIESGATLDIIHREISIHRKINHDNIVKVFSHHENENFFYLIMEYVNGGSLFSLIKKNKGIDEKRAFKYFIQACAAVNFLHSNNLIHRDLKPENILISDKDIVKLCDFGWCVDISTGSRVTFCGTYEYMAPEIVKELPYDFEIDVWSLGILLYELTHGYSPFRAEKEDCEDYNEIFKKILKYKFKIEKELSSGCVDLITKLLTPDNRKRIKIREIFQHPWVIEMEVQHKEDIKKTADNPNNLNNSKIDTGKSLSKQQTQPLITKPVLDSSFKNELKSDVSDLLEKIVSKEKSKKKIKSSKEKDGKLKKIDKLKSEKLIKKDNLINLENEEEKPCKNKLEKKKTLDKSTNQNSSNQDISNLNNLSNENKNNTSEGINNRSNDNTEKNIDKTNKITNVNIIEYGNDSKIYEDRKPPKKNSIDVEKGKNLSLNLIPSIPSGKNISINMNNSINKPITTDIFNLDLSNVNDKNNFNILSTNRDFDISPDKNIDCLKQTKVNDISSYVINNNLQYSSNNSNKDNNDLSGNGNNNYFDHVLQNIKNKNTDKNSKKLKNKEIDSLLNTVSANLVNSKIYSEKSVGEEKKNHDLNKNNLSSSNFQNLLVSSNSVVFFEKDNRSPIKFDESNASRFNLESQKNTFNNNIFPVNFLESQNSTYNNNMFSGGEKHTFNVQEEKEENIVTQNIKLVKSLANQELYQIDEIPKKKKIIKKIKTKSKNNLENENMIVEKGRRNSKIKRDEHLFVNLDRLSDEEVKLDFERKYDRRKMKTNDYEYDEDIIFTKNNEFTNNNIKSYKIPDDFLEEMSIYPKKHNKDNIQTRNKSGSENFKPRVGKDNLMTNTDIRDLDKQLNLEFLPRDLLYNDITYDDSSKRMLESMEILEKAKLQKIREKEVVNEKKEDDESFWNKLANAFNPFKCVNYGNPN